MLIEKYIEIFMSHLPHGAKVTRKCVEMNCPCCTYMGERRSDTRMRGGFFNRGNEIGYNCFNCGFKFRASDNQELPFKAVKFLELLGVAKTEINQLHFLALRANPASSFLRKQKQNININLNFKTVSLPTGATLLHDIIRDASPDSDAFAAYVYAKSRGIEKYPFLLWVDNKSHKLNKRLTIPYIFKDKIVGFNSRLFDSDDKTERYYEINPNKNFVFNLDSVFKERKIMIINESPFDSIIYDGVSTMGADISTDHCNLINQFKGRKILVPDPDKSGKKAIDVAAKNGWEVYYPTWTYKFDMGEAIQNFGKLYVLNDIINNSISDPLEIEIKKNLI